MNIDLKIARLRKENAILQRELELSNLLLTDWQKRVGEKSPAKTVTLAPMPPIKSRILLEEAINY